MAKLGRKTKKTPEMIERLTAALSHGCTRTAAVSYAGISYETFTVYMEDSDFSETIKKAEYAAKAYFEDKIYQEAKKNWNAAAWWLERRHWNEYAKRTVTHDTNDTKGDIQDIEFIITEATEADRPSSSEAEAQTAG